VKPRPDSAKLVWIRPSSIFNLSHRSLCRKSLQTRRLASLFASQPSPRLPLRQRRFLSTSWLAFLSSQMPELEILIRSCSQSGWELSSVNSIRKVIDAPLDNCSSCGKILICATGAVRSRSVSLL